MKGDVYYGKGIRELKDDYPDLYELVSNIMILYGMVKS